MVNKKGGKGYKKGKHQDSVPDFVERIEGQQYGRVLRILGNCRVIVYCDDDERRICHIRGAIRKRVWIEVGDIVLVSFREFENHDGGADDMEKGDVLAKVDPRHQSKLKKDPCFNQKLLCDLEKIDMTNGGGAGGGAGGGLGQEHQINMMMAAAAAAETEDGGQAKVSTITTDDINAMFGNSGYEFDRDEEDDKESWGGDGDDDGSGSGSNSDDEGKGKNNVEATTVKKEKPNYEARHKLQAIKRNEQRSNKNNKEINIDEI